MKTKIIHSIITLCLCFISHNVFAWGKWDLLSGSNVGAQLTFSDSGTYEWAWDSTNMRLQSSNKGVDSSTSTSTITFSTNTQSTLSFNYAVSSETNYDKLTITLDGTVIVNGISGNTSSKYTGTLAQGSHKLIVSYSKDVSQSTNNDLAYISDLYCAVYSGTTGDLTWNVDGETLTISGAGRMDYYSMRGSGYGNPAPWYCFRKLVKNLTISDECTYISSFAFYGMNNIKSVSIPASVTSIGTGAFEGCYSLNTLRFEESSNSLSIAGPYDDCPDSDSWCYVHVFQGANITSLYLGRNVDTSGFSEYNFTNTASVHLGKHVSDTKIIGLIKSHSLSLTFDDENLRFKVVDDVLYSADMTTLLNVLPNKSGSLIIPASVDSISNGAAYNNKNITSLYLSSPVNIGRAAFYDCTNLKYVDIPSSCSITTDYYDVFRYWDNSDESEPYLENLTFNYGDLKSLCESNIELSAGKTLINNQELSQVLKGNIVIPEGVTHIRTRLFKGNKNITGIQFPNSLKTIEYSAFEGCYSISNLELPNSLKSIGTSAFKGCTGISSLVFPDSLRSIESSAFEGCYSISNLELPNSLKSIGTSAFNGCTRISSLVFPDSLRSIGSSAFRGCTRISSIEFSDSIQSIDEYAFSGCNEITNVSLPSGLTFLAPCIFEGCSKLKVLEIPESVERISTMAFNGTNLKAVICRSTTPPTSNYNGSASQNGNPRIYVPRENIDAYKTEWRSIFATNTYLPIVGLSFFEKQTAESYAAALSEMDKSKITSVTFYLGGLDSELTEDLLKDGMNPNCLYYVTSDASISGENIIMLDDYSAESISLVDGYDFECPIAFHANQIKYTHNPSVWATGRAGWETICLPFAPETYKASERGYISPITIGSTGNFWLRKLVGTSSDALYFASTTDGIMEANTPYIIAFPGSTMGSGHLQGQTITFEASDTDIPVTTQPELHNSPFTFIGNYDSHADDTEGWVLDTTGGTFIKSKTVGDRPFTAYFKSEEIAGAAARSLRMDFNTWDESTSIANLRHDDITIKQVGNGTLAINALRSMPVEIRSINGTSVRKVELVQGVNCIDNLNRGIYIIDNKKIFVK